MRAFFSLLFLTIFGVSALAQFEGVSGGFYDCLTCRHRSKQEIILGELKKAMAENPFPGICNDAKNLSYRPHAQFSPPTKDFRGNSSRKMLLEIGKRVRDYASQNIWQMVIVNQCLEAAFANQAPPQIKGNESAEVKAQCGGILNWVDQGFPEIVKQARYHLLMSYDDGLMRSINLEPNSSLKLFRSYKATAWEKPSPREIQNARRDLISYIPEIKKQFYLPSTKKEFRDAKLNPSLEQYAKDSIRSVRMHSHFEKYKSYMAEFPVLNYITKANPSRLDMMNALKMMMEHAANEMRMINQDLAALEKSPNSIPSRSLRLMSYTGIVSGYLAENHQQECGLAAALIETRENRSFGLQMAMALPLMAVTVMAPPMIAVTAGAAGSVGFIAIAQNDYLREKDQNIVWSPSSGLENENLNQALGARNMSVKMVAADVVARGLAKGTGSVFGFMSRANRITAVQPKLLKLRLKPAISR